METKHATVHKGPKGGTEYRLWTSETTFFVARKFKAWPYMSEKEKSKAESMEESRRIAEAAKQSADSAWRNILRGG
jgi:hypothetical protein